MPETFTVNPQTIWPTFANKFPFQRALDTERERFVVIVHGMTQAEADARAARIVRAMALLEAQESLAK